MAPQDQEPAAEVFRNWLNRGIPGCKFASVLAAKGKVSYYVSMRPIEDEKVESINAHIDRAAGHDDVAVLLFPHVRDERAGAATLIELLSESQRWSEERRELPEACRAGREETVGVSLFFETKHSERACAMGFSPSAGMPMTRRAPYLGLAVWAGRRSNPFWTEGSPGTVNMSHAPPLAEDAAQHEKLWKESKTRTRALLSEPQDDYRWVREITFCLQADSLHDERAAAIRSERGPSEA